MPKVHYVDSARAAKHPRRCVECGEEVQGLESYWYAEAHDGKPKLFWCYRHPPEVAREGSQI